MNTFTLVFLCIQALFFQHVFSTCCGSSPYVYSRTTSPYSTCGYQATSIAPYGNVSPYNYGYNNGCGCNSCYNGYNYNGYNNGYGGIGQGAVGVTGVMPVSGATKVCGTVPVVGAVQFSGPARAAGRVTVTGQTTCGCGCGSYYP